MRKAWRVIGVTVAAGMLTASAAACGAGTRGDAPAAADDFQPVLPPEVQEGLPVHELPFRNTSLNVALLSELLQDPARLPVND